MPNLLTFLFHHIESDFSFHSYCFVCKALNGRSQCILALLNSFTTLARNQNLFLHLKAPNSATTKQTPKGKPPARKWQAVPSNSLVTPSTQVRIHQGMILGKRISSPAGKTAC